jgi:hypothetical protein
MRSYKGPDEQRASNLNTPAHRARPHLVPWAVGVQYGFCIWALWCAPFATIIQNGVAEAPAWKTCNPRHSRLKLTLTTSVIITMINVAMGTPRVRAGAIPFSGKGLSTH